MTMEPIHPGETLAEILANEGMLQRQLALKTGIPEGHIRSFINGESSVTISFAKSLERGFKIDASFWINLQKNYDAELYLRDRKDE